MKKTRFIQTLIALFVTIAVALPCMAGVPDPTPINLGALPIPGYDYSIATAINNRGQVAGYSYNGDSPIELPVIWQNGQIARLPLPEGVESGMAFDINDSGTIVGACGRFQACVWTPTGQGYTVTMLDGPSLTDPSNPEFTVNFRAYFASKINNSGDILVALAALDEQGEPITSFFCGAFFKDGVWEIVKDAGGLPHGFSGFVSLASMNEARQLLFYSENSDEEGKDLWIYTNGVATKLLEDARWAKINNHGQVVGMWFNEAAGRTENFTYDAATGAFLGAPFTDTSYLFVNINDNGDILVSKSEDGYFWTMGQCQLWTTKFENWTSASPLTTYLGSYGGYADGAAWFIFNANSEVGGYSWYDDKALYASASTGTVHLDGNGFNGYSEVTDMNDYGMVIGNQGDHALLWRGNDAPTADAGPDRTVNASSATADVTLNGAGSFDPNGDALTYEWTENGILIASGAAPLVTLSTGTHEITLTVTDTYGLTGTDTVAVTVGFGYSWSGLLQPIDPPNADGVSSSVFKAGSTVPVKFYLTGESSGLTTLSATLSFAKVNNGVSGTDVEAVSTASATTGNLFRYDAASGQYIFNWSTKGLTSGTYRLSVNLGDGVTRTTDIGLK